MLFSGVRKLLLGSSRVSHLELAKASFSTLSQSCGTALIQADAMYYLLMFVSPSGDLVAPMGGPDPHPTPAGSHAFLGASMRTFTEATV